jgi:hypothetical protein
MKRTQISPSPTPVRPAPAASKPRPGQPPDKLDPDLIDSVLASGADVRPGYDQREDGWTPERIAIFLNTLAEWGIVSDAARAAGVTRQAAYALRNSAKGRAFQLAWRAAILLARRRLADDLMSRAVSGQVDQLYRDGELWRERHRLDNRLALALLTRLDRLAAEDEVDPAATIVADEFEQFVAIAAKDGNGAAAFVRNRASGRREVREAEILQRSENYGLYGVGHPGEIDVSDLDLEWKQPWTAEQVDRAIRAGVLRKLRPHEFAVMDEPVESGRTRYAIVQPDGDWVVIDV